MALHLNLSPRFYCVLCLLLAHCIAQPLTYAESPDPETQVKNTYLCKFGNYVHWPKNMLANPDSNIVIGLATDDAVAEEVARVARRHKAGNHTLSVKRLQRGDTLNGIHILFIGKSENEHLADWLAMAQGQPILTITEAEQGLAVGSIINFVMDGNRVRFDVSNAAAERNKIKLDAELLSVARQVEGKPP